ncbi:leucine--tRNA ligase, partial [Patescibacteria group bacterium]
MKYNPQKIEKKWQKKWDEQKIYEAKNSSKKKKFYCLDMFPYPSGDGLHVGHPKGYIATDVMARFKMLNGYNVLHPMGWDAFGLPAENYAIKNKVHPREAVEKNIKRFKKQLKKIGFTYDWLKEINTTDPEYYKWTQWIFLQMFKKGLAYESYEPINWCPSCKTGLANEDIENGKCERCGSIIEKKPMRQWVLKMTAYADRLLKDLELLDWESEIIEQQRNWISRSQGVEFDMSVKNSDEKIKVYTTRVDTSFGMTYAVVAPEHPIIEKLKSEIKNYKEVQKYIAETKKKSDLERTELQKEKTGVELNGIKVVNPFNNQEIPLFVADYVLGNYGTGAVMAVPAHDYRDWEFAKKHNLKIIHVVNPIHNVKNNNVFIEDGVLANSEEFTGLSSAKARQEMARWLIKKKIGRKKINYKMRDWVFSRQRYWGEPIPIIHCEKCGAVAVPEKDLPVKLPNVKQYEPTGTGESPLSKMKEWVNTKCPKCKGPAKRETNTMPQWAGSSWYYLRYIDPENKKELIGSKKEKYWMPVDLYVGGAEHATRHLLYARFWHKFLYDIRIVSTKEPFKKLLHVGLINAKDGKKMSKRWNNVINPDDMIAKFGADSLRLYEMFMGPFNQPVSWNTQGLIGMKRFLDRVWTISGEENSELKIIHKTIKKVTEDIKEFKFNTAISSLMVCLNDEDFKRNKKAIKSFLILLSPFAPHITEELWEKLGNKESIFLQKWPEYDEKLITEEKFNLIIQINGKFRDKIEIEKNISKDKIEELTLE